MIEQAARYARSFLAYTVPVLRRQRGHPGIAERPSSRRDGKVVPCPVRKSVRALPREAGWPAECPQESVVKKPGDVAERGPLANGFGFSAADVVAMLLHAIPQAIGAEPDGSRARSPVLVSV